MKTLILLGGGHAHLAVLKLLEGGIPSGWRVQLLSPSQYQTYSGMLPGWIAGHYLLRDCQIDLLHLCERANVEFIIDKAMGLDANRRCVALPSGLHLEYDLLSLDIGSESDLSCLAQAGEKLLPIRPIDDFVFRWTEIVNELKQGNAIHIAVVGGGAAGVELALAMQYFKQNQNLPLEIDLVCSKRGVLPGFPSAAINRMQRVIVNRGLQLHHEMAAGAEEGLLLSNGHVISADFIVAALGGRAPIWLQLSKLALSARGFIALNAAQQSISHPNVFAAGDVGARASEHARSGVHAVRAGPILAMNLLQVMQGDSLKIEYVPQKNTLYLIATGPQYAVASWGKFSAEGRWVWLWKQWIDRRFVAKYNRGLCHVIT